MKDADILTLPCVTPWGAPPAGVLFTPEAFARYSVSSRTAAQHADAELSASPASPPAPVAAEASDGDAHSMEALSGYASPDVPMPDSDGEAQSEPGIGDEAEPDAVPATHPESPAQTASQRVAAPAAGAREQRSAATPLNGDAARRRGTVAEAGAAAAKAAGGGARTAAAQRQAPAAAAKPKQRRQPATQKQLVSRKRKATGRNADHSGRGAQEVEVITSNSPADAAAQIAAPAAGPGAITAAAVAAAAAPATAAAARQGLAKVAAAEKRRQWQAFKWSSLTEDDHRWYLEHHGRKSDGQEGQVLAALEGLVAEERQAVLGHQWQQAAQEPERYRFVARRALQQMEVDNTQRRARVRSYPRLYRLHASIPVPGADAGADEEEEAEPPNMWHLQQLARTPPDLELAQPRCVFRVPLDVPYLPSELEIGPQAAPQAPAAPPASSDQAAADGAKGAKGKPSQIRGVRKAAAPEISQDPTLVGFVAAAAGDEGAACDVAMAAVTFETLVATLPHDRSLGWEIPLRIGPPETPAGADSTPGVAAGQRGGGGAAAAPPKCIWLDKPLLRRELTLRERHERLYKHAMLSLGVRAAGNAAAAAFGAAVRVDSGAAAKSADPPPAPGSAAAMQQAAVAQSAAEAAGSGDAGRAPQADAGASAVVQSPKRLTRAAARAATTAATNGAATSPSDAAAPAGEGAGQGPTGGAAQHTHTAAGAAASQQAATADSGARSEGAAAAAASGGPPASGSAEQDGAGRPAAQAGGVVTAARGCTYDLWQLGRFRVVVRSHETALLRDPARPPVLVRAKMEYIPKQGMEAVTAIEAARRWAALQLRPEAALMVGRVAVETSELLRVELLRLAEVLAQGEETGFKPVHAYRLATALLEPLSEAPPGRYLLAHAPNADSVTCFRALPPELDLPEVRAQPLPCAGAQASVVYDLHAAHANSGATDAQALPFVPPEWRPFNPHVPQIPGTFPVRVRGAPKPGARGPDEEAKAKRRLRKLLPSAWARLGVGGDWDASAATAPGSSTGGVAAGFSREEYARALADEDAEEI